jgi:large subunit ribosomal protein L25
MDVKKIEITAEIRADSGRGVLSQMRRGGSIPCVVYGKGIDALSLIVNEKDVRELIANASSGKLITLKILGEKRSHRWPVLIKEVQRHPTKNNVLHIDFHKIELDEEVTINVPVVITGEAARERDGGIVQLVLKDLEIQCLPTEIPERIEADVSELKIGDVIKVENINTDENITVLTSRDEVVVSVVLPTAREEVAEPEDTDSEPELVREDDDDDNEE